MKAVIENAILSGKYDVDVDGNVYGPMGLKKQRIGGNGYPVVDVCAADKELTVPVHRLIAFKKFGVAAHKPGIQTRHLNGISTDNTWDNIAIGTQADNEGDKSPDARCVAYATRLDEQTVRKLRQEFNQGGRITEMARKYNIPVATLSDAVHGKTWRHI